MFEKKKKKEFFLRQNNKKSKQQNFPTDNMKPSSKGGVGDSLACLNPRIDTDNPERYTAASLNTVNVKCMIYLPNQLPNGYLNW